MRVSTTCCRGRSFTGGAVVLMLLPWARLSVHAALNDDEFVLVDAPGVEERRSSASKNPVAAAPSAPQVAGELEDHYGNGLDNENTARDATAAGAAFSSPVDRRGTTTSSEKEVEGDEEDDLSQWGLVCESSFTNVISAAKEQAEADVRRLAAQSALREASRKIAQKMAKDNLAAVYDRVSGAGQAMPKIPGDVLEEAGADGRVKDDDVVMLPSDEQEVNGDRIDASPSSKKKERAGGDVAPAPSMYWKLPSYPFSLAGFYNEPTVDVADSTVVATPVKEPEGEPGAVVEEDQEFGYQKMDSSPESAADVDEEEFEMVANDEDPVLQDEDVPIMHTGPPAEASDDGFSSSGSSAATVVAARKIVNSALLEFFTKVRLYEHGTQLDSMRDDDEENAQCRVLVTGSESRNPFAIATISPAAAPFYASPRFHGVDRSLAFPPSSPTRDAALFVVRSARAPGNNAVALEEFARKTFGKGRGGFGYGSVVAPQKPNSAGFLSTYTASETPGPAYINIDEGSLLETHFRREAESGTTALVRSRGRGRPLLGNDYSAPKKLRIDMNQAYKVQEDPVSEALFLLASSSSGTNFLPRGGTELRPAAAYSCAAAGMRFLGQSLHVRSPWSVSRYGSERASTVTSPFGPALYPTRYKNGPLSRSTLSNWNKSSGGDEMKKNPFATTFSGSFATAADPHAKLTYAALLRELRAFEELLVRSLIADLEERIDADDAQMYQQKRQRLGLRNRLQYELLKLAARARAQNKRLVGQIVEDDEGEREDRDEEVVVHAPLLPVQMNQEQKKLKDQQEHHNKASARAEGASAKIAARKAMPTRSLVDSIPNISFVEDDEMAAVWELLRNLKPNTAVEFVTKTVHTANMRMLTCAEDRLQTRSPASTASHGKPPGVFNTWASEYQKNLLTQSADKARKASTVAAASATRRATTSSSSSQPPAPEALVYNTALQRRPYGVDEASLYEDLRYASPWTYYFPDVLAARGGRHILEQGSAGGLRRRRSSKSGKKFSGDPHLLLDDGEDDFYGREGGFYGSYDFGGEDFYSSKAYGPYDHEFRIHDFPAHQHHETSAPPVPDARPETPEADADMDIPAPEVDAPAPVPASPDSPEVLDWWGMQEEQEPAASASPTSSQPYWRTPEGAEAHELIYNAYLKSHAKQAQAHDPKGGKTSLRSGAAPYHPAAEFAGSYGGEHDFHGQHYGSSWTAENEAAYAAMLQHRASLHHGEIAANVGGFGDGRWSKENQIQNSRRYKGGHSLEEPNDTEEQRRARGRALADDIRKAMQRKRETVTKHEEVKAQRRAQRYFKSMMAGKQEDPEVYLADTTGSAGSTSSPSPPSSPPENTSTAPEARPFGEEVQTFRPIMKTTTSTPKDSEHQTSGSEEVGAFFDGSTFTEEQEKVNKEHSLNDLQFNWDIYSNISASQWSSAGAVKKKTDTTSSSTDYTQNDGIDEIDAALKTVSLKGMKGTSSGTMGVGRNKKIVPKGTAEARSFLKGGAVGTAGSKWKPMVLPGAAPGVSTPWEAVAPGKGNKNWSGTRRPKWEPRIDKATGKTIWEYPDEVGTTARYTWEKKTDEATGRTYWERQWEEEVAPATSSVYAWGSKADKATGRTNWQRQGDHVVATPASYTWEARTDTATGKNTLEEDGASKLTYYNAVNKRHANSSGKGTSGSSQGGSGWKQAWTWSA